MIKLVQSSTCFRCGRLTDDFKVCVSCRSSSALNKVITGAVWQDGPLRSIVHQFKYRRIRVVTQRLAGILARNLQPYINEATIIAPVPLHNWRYLNRGFNHAEDLANAVAEQFGITKIASLIIKIKRTKPQAKLSRRQRLKNLQDVFVVSPKYINQIKGKTIIVIDDIVTTGTTLHTCAKVLKQAGAKEVWGLALARV